MGVVPFVKALLNNKNDLRSSCKRALSNANNMDDSFLSTDRLKFLSKLARAVKASSFASKLFLSENSALSPGSGEHSPMPFISPFSSIVKK